MVILIFRRGSNSMFMSASLDTANLVEGTTAILPIGTVGAATATNIDGMRMKHSLILRRMTMMVNNNNNAGGQTDWNVINGDTAAILATVVIPASSVGEFELDDLAVVISADTRINTELVDTNTSGTIAKNWVGALEFDVIG